MRLLINNAVWWALVFDGIVQASQCAAPPINLPLRTVSVAPGALSHGIPISIGTPPQQLVLTPSLQLDTTFIPRYTNSCVYGAGASIPANDTRWDGRDGMTVCAGIYGGGFVPSLSTSFFDNGTSSPVSEAWFKIARFSDWHFMTDEFIFADYMGAYVQQNEMLPGKRNTTTSFILPNEGARFGGLGNSALSLTPSSRLVEALYTEGMIPSKSWSLSNESLCLGCIDENAHTAEFVSFKLADRGTNEGLPCLLQVKVESLDYHDDASSTGVALLKNAFVACIDPAVAFLVLPTDARTKLREVIGSDGNANDDWFATTSDPLKNRDGFLRFRLDGNLEVDVAISGPGEAGEKVLAIQSGSWGAYGEDVPVLGIPFTGSTVLRWDEATQEYGLAKKNPKANGKSDLKPLGCDQFPALSRSRETTPNVGIIVGSIVGGFAAGLLFAAAAVFFYWRGQRGVRSKYETMRGEDTVSLRTVDTGGRSLESRGTDTMSLPASSLRESLLSRFGKRSVSPVIEPYLVGDSEVFEAPEGGTANPTKRNRVEIGGYSYDHR